MGVQDSWNKVLQMLCIARNASDADQTIGPSISRMIYSMTQPSIFYLQIVAVSDEAVTTYMDENCISLPGNVLSTLHNKLCHLASLGVIEYTDELKQVRRRRNAIAHDTGDISDQNIFHSWEDIDGLLSFIESFLLSIGAIETTPEYSFLHQVIRKPYPDGIPINPMVRIISMYYSKLTEGDNDLLVFESGPYINYPPGYSPTPEQESADIDYAKQVIAAGV